MRKLVERVSGLLFVTGVFVMITACGQPQASRAFGPNKLIHYLSTVAGKIRLVLRSMSALIFLQTSCEKFQVKVV